MTSPSLRTPARIHSATDAHRLLRDLREGRGITQQGMAGRLHVHVDTYGKRERNRRHLTVTEWLRALDILGCDLIAVPRGARGWQAITGGPKTALSASVAAETPLAGIPGGVGGAEAISGASEAFEVHALAPYGGVADLSLRCTRCVRWAVHIDRPIGLRDLNERAQEHAEVCR